MTDPAEDSSLEPLAVRDFSGPRDFVKAANEEHGRRIGSLPKTVCLAAAVAPWTYKMTGPWATGQIWTDEQWLLNVEVVTFLGVEIWNSEDTPFSIEEMFAAASSVATNASVWADE